MSSRLATKVVARKLNGKGKGRGIYSKKAEREAAGALPCAWTIGDRRSFYAARARLQRGLLGALDLHGREKAALGAALDHMHANERWSCYASIPLLAQESGVSEATCWRAIGKADGKYI